MAKQIGETEFLPPDHPLFKQGAVLVGVAKSEPSRKPGDGDTAEEPETPTGPEPMEKPKE